ncbi:MAG: glycosyltransferase [Nitrospirae bacterium]|nr:glycosyltransferase [Nitrospirota bacterium]
MLKRVLIAYHQFPPLMDYLKIAFEKRGIEVKTFVMETNHWFDRFIIHNVDKQLWNLKLLAKGKSAFDNHPLSHLRYRSELIENLVDSFKPDLFLLIRGWRITEQSIKNIRRKTKVMGWWIEKEDKFDSVLDEIAFYDHFFAISSNSVDTAIAHGHKNTSLMYQAVDSSLFRPIDDIKPVYDCCFVGGWSDKRQRIIEQAVSLTEKVAIYGPRWRKNNSGNPKMLNSIKADFIESEELVKLYNRSKIVLNSTNWGDGSTRGGMTLRVFEAPACGAFLLSDESGDIEKILPQNTHIGVYKDLEDFRNKLSYYLSNEAERKEIALNAYNQVVTHHTYDNVVENIITSYSNLCNLP